MSTKTVAQKLLIKPGTTLWLSPDTAPNLIAPLPEDIIVTTDLATATVALLSVSSAAHATSTLHSHAASLAKPGVLWVLYPKGDVTDINRDSLWPLLAVHGLRPITQVAIDDTWSALRFRPLRPDEAPFTGGR